jgi:hypothetical protein
MKKTITFLLFLLISGIIFSCKKETPNEVQSLNVSDNKVSSLVRNFKQFGSAGLKSSWEVSPDSAIWYLGATANYTYGDASRETENTWTDTCFFAIPMANQKVTVSVLFNKYAELIDKLRDMYHSRNEENKQLLAVSVKISNYNTDTLVCMATATFAYGPILVSCVFNNTDYWSFWKYYGNGGICDGPNSGTHPESDAAEEIQKRIMACKGVPMGNYYYENVITETIIDPLEYPIDPTFNTPVSNDRYSHLYWNSSQYPNFDGCISPADLNFYLAKTKDLIYKDTINGGIRPVGYSFISIDMQGNEGMEAWYTLYYHIAFIKYGILRLSPDPTLKLDN